MSQDRGELAIVLHTHMPYVEGFGTWPFGEEWLWRCVAESYLRLEPTLASQPLSIALTPVLADQFEQMRGAAGDRMLGFYNDSREYVYGEDLAAFEQIGEPKLKAALEPQLADYRRATARFEEIGRDLNALFKNFAAGGAELLGGPATHPVMPLLATDFGSALQLEVGRESHSERFSSSGHGIWLPECAYADGVDRQLAAAGVTHFCVDQSAVHGEASLDNLQPVALRGGELVAAPIDWLTIKRVWDEHGYPGASEYRSTFRRSIHNLMPWNNDGDAYDPAAARRHAELHAADFLGVVRERLDRFRAERGSGGLCVFAIDTELLGHWWYEGPWWLAAVCRDAADAGVELTTLGAALDRHQPVERPLARSSWGARKDLSTWDSPPVADFAWQARRAELDLDDLLLAHRDAIASSGPQADAAVAAARELLALQASDWSFMASRQTAGEYAADRFAAHLAAFRKHADAMQQSVRPKHDRSGGDGPAAQTTGLAPGLTNEKLAAIRCAY